MSITAIAIIAAAIGLIAVILARGSGPRVTTIETRREDSDEHDKDSRQ